MNWPTFTMWLVSSTALLSSIGAWFAVRHLWRRSRSTSSERLSGRLTEIESQIEALTSQVKNLRSARNMAAYRERKAAREPELSTEQDEIDGQESPEQTRARLNEELALGKRKALA